MPGTRISHTQAVRFYSELLDGQVQWVTASGGIFLLLISCDRQKKERNPCLFLKQLCAYINWILFSWRGKGSSKGQCVGDGAVRERSLIKRGITHQQASVLQGSFLCRYQTGWETHTWLCHPSPLLFAQSALTLRCTLIEYGEPWDWQRQKKRERTRGTEIIVIKVNAKAVLNISSLSLCLGNTSIA